MKTDFERSFSASEVYLPQIVQVIEENSHLKFLNFGGDHKDKIYKTDALFQGESSIVKFSFRVRDIDAQLKYKFRYLEENLNEITLSPDELKLYEEGNNYYPTDFNFYGWGGCDGQSILFWKIYRTRTLQKLIQAKSAKIYQKTNSGGRKFFILSNIADAVIVKSKSCELSPSEKIKFVLESLERHQQNVDKSF